MSAGRGELCANRTFDSMVVYDPEHFTRWLSTNGSGSLDPWILDPKMDPAEALDLYDPAEAWSTAPVMPSMRFNHSSAGLDGKLYITGGQDENCV